MTGSQLETSPQTETVIVERMHPELVIVGGGPAGLSAGIYAKRFGLNVLLMEKAISGGSMAEAYTIENYPGFPKGIRGLELAKSFEEQAGELGLGMTWGEVSSIEYINKTIQIAVDEGMITARALIIATGTEPKEIGAAGEEEFKGRGVSYCATCDAPFYKNKKIAVVGGGNSALQEALFLTQFASMVTVIHRRDELRADAVLEREAKNNPKIYFVWDSTVEKIEGKDTVEAVMLKNEKTGKKTRVPMDGIFVYIGSTPNTSCLKGLVPTDKDGFLVTDEEMRTSLPGIFAAGDVRAKSLRQIVTAASDGAIAAFSAYKFLRERH